MGYTKVVENVSADTLMTHIHANTRKGSVYYTAVKGYQSLERYGKHHDNVNYLSHIIGGGGLLWL